MESHRGKSDGLLNPFQENHFFIALRHADQLLCDCEQILASSASQSPFPAYVADFNELDQTALSDHISRLRASFVTALSRLGMNVPPPHISALRAIQTNLDFIDMDFEELRPKSMKGYGALQEEASNELGTMVGEMQEQLRVMAGYLKARTREL